MLRNYIIAALRNLVRNRFYSTIGILALAVGLCAATLAAVTLRNELTYEQFIPGYENTYLASSTIIPTGRAPVYNLESPGFVASVLKLNVRQIQAVTRIVATNVRLRHDQTEATESVYWADPNAFELLPLPVLAGDLKQALRRPDGIVLTRSIAEKYFGRATPIGQSILLDGSHPMTVTAIVDDLPVKGTMLGSGIFASGLAEFSRLNECERQDVANRSRNSVSLCGLTYVRLAPNTEVDSLQQSIDSFVSRAYPQLPGVLMSVQLIRIDRVHLFEGLNPGMRGRIAVFSAVSLGVLLAACIVFLNLSTARSTRRAMEVGVRKVYGARQIDLVMQFLGESLIYVVLATCLGLALAHLALPSVNAFLNSGGNLDFLHDPKLIGALLIGIVVVAALAGGYPALVLSAFQPHVVFKGISSGSSGGRARQLLVVLQFALLIGLLVAVTVIYRQSTYLTRDALRVDTDQMLALRSACKPALLNELRALPGVRGAQCSAMALLDRQSFSNMKLSDGTSLAIDWSPLEFGTFALYGITPLAGNLPTGVDDATEPASNPQFVVVINEAAVRRFGFSSPSAAIGQSPPLADVRGVGRTIIAVVPDFAFDVGIQPIRPTFFVDENPERYRLINVRLTGRDIPETLDAIDRIGVATGSDKPLERFFVNTYIQNLYLSTVRGAQALSVFAVIAIVLACLGLLGLAAAAAESRTREIGIRKAMGAGTADILRMLLWQFSTPILWANFVAWPFTYLIMQRWLEGYAFRIEISPLIFLAAGVFSLVIALATVAGHALLIARTKPLVALRYE